MTLAGTGLVGVAQAPAAEAAGSCSYAIYMYSAVNNTCYRLRHYDILTTGVIKYAPWVGAGKTSAQSTCWTNVDHYSAEINP